MLFVGQYYNLLISYMNLASKFLVKMHTRKELPLAISLLLHHCMEGVLQGIGCTAQSKSSFIKVGIKKYHGIYHANAEYRLFLFIS